MSRGRENEREWVRRWVDRGAAPQGRAEALLRDGRPAAAAALVETELASRPGDLKALCLAAIARLSTGELPAAQGFFERAVSIHPKSAMALGLKGFLLDSRFDASAAGRALGQAMRLSPKAGWPLALRSQLHRDGERLRECLGDLTEALKRGPEAWIYRLRAECLDKLGRMVEAIADLDAGLALSPKDPLLHGMRGHCLFHRKDYEAAAAAFSRGLRSAPGDTSLLTQRADCWWLAGRYEKARRDLKNCVRLEPESFAHRLSLARLQILTGRDAGVTFTLNRWQASKVPEREAGASFLKGMLYFRRARYERAAREFARAEGLARAGRYPGRFVDVGYSEMARGFEFMRRHRRGAEKKGRGAALVLTGLGLDYPYQASLEVLKVFSECDIIVNNLAGAEVMDFLRLFCRDVRTISFEGERSLSWTDRIFKWIKPGLKVAFVTRGHPLVSGHLALSLIERARKEGVTLRCYGAVSSVDQILALTEEVLSETYWGMQVLDSQLLLAGKVLPQTGLPTILYLSSRPGAAGHRGMIRRLCGVLSKAYGTAHKLRVFGPRYDSRALEEVAVAGLEKFLAGIERRMYSSMILLLPPLSNLSPNPARKKRGRGDGAEL